ncbi:hypothetical protein [Nocardioides sp. URHA0032]|uniref:hypothetical protein n=1 Tax=Nocardioides sp. URHA0032 TaxID=1380388 RepID=UPI0006875473|nr:hypothetical protein [Nocardioides sp. URHA0032]
MDEDAIRRLLRGQAGVLSRAQVLECGATDAELEGLLRRRAWTTVHRGVYVDHSGPLTWDQRAWAAVLLHAPAVLSGRSAMRAHRMRVQPAIASGREPIEIMVEAGRRVGPTKGISIRRGQLEAVSQPAAQPPRLHLEDPVLVAASDEEREDAAVAVLVDACAERRTTATRLAAALPRHPRLGRRRLLASVLDDAGTGVPSAVERRYVAQVERAHGLPRGIREDRAEGGGQRDVRYSTERVVVELDGRLAHGRAEQHWADLDRRPAVGATGDVTVRLAWGQVLDPCRVAAAVARLLASRGWAGRPVPCGSRCPLTSSGGSPAPGADDPPLSPR